MCVRCDGEYMGNKTPDNENWTLLCLINSDDAVLRVQLTIFLGCTHCWQTTTAMHIVVVVDWCLGVWGANPDQNCRQHTHRPSIAVCFQTNAVSCYMCLQIYVWVRTRRVIIIWALLRAYRIMANLIIIRESCLVPGMCISSSNWLEMRRWGRFEECAQLF